MWYVRRSKIAGSKTMCTLILIGCCPVVLYEDCTSLYSHQPYMWMPFPWPLWWHCVFTKFCLWQFGKWKMVSQYSLICCSLVGNAVGHLFICLELFISSPVNGSFPSPTFQLDCWSFPYWFVDALCIMGNLAFVI